MTDRIFLEDVGTPHSANALGRAKAWKVRHLRNDPSLPPLIYVVESDVSQQLLLGREISGRPKFNMIRYLAKSFVDLFFEELSGKACSQYLILRGAYPFDLQYAIGCTPPYETILLPTGFMKLQRVLNPEGTGWEIQGQNFIGEYQGDTWLIPDPVIASGSTIAFFLRNGFDHHRPERVYVITAFGSLEGLQRIYQECLERGVELIPVLFQCIFQVSKVGNLPGRPLTDLSVLNSGSITTRQFYEKASHRYQGKPMCCVGDISKSLDDPIQYSIETLWEMERLRMDPKKENWDGWTINIREEAFKKRVLDFNPDLFDYFKEIW
ncbi:MAG: phosphoribosyltransferase [Syntrophaceae bacterium]|nr:phosphoribosyltransferase [Syntrophaceae bacterium]